MAETDLHRDEMADLIAMLKERWRDDGRVYVAGNLFVYYVEGDASACFAPDVFVVFGVDDRQRRVYKLWEEGVAPRFVLEVSSRKTWLEDLGNKRALCARLGVDEYIVYDPDSDYLDPPLKGFRLVDGEYRPMRPLQGGALESEALGLRLSLEADGRLCLHDAASGERLDRPAEVAAARREAEARAERLAALLAAHGIDPEAADS